MQDDERSPGIDLDADLALIRAAAEEAGSLALDYFRQSPDVWYKNHDRSPVSEADLAVDALLHERLAPARPDYGWLSEESDDPSGRTGLKTLFVVDPIDGTRGFIAGNDVWCVSVAVVHRGRSVAGVLVAPATGEVFTAHAGACATKNGEPISVTAPGDDETRRLVVAAPERLFGHLPETVRTEMSRVGHIPSLAYRLAMVADGRLDGTLVRRNANDWDIAAAHVILERAGGTLLRQDGEAVVYDRADTGHGVLVAGSGAALTQLSRALESLPGH